eukprot:gene19865-14455_t
MSTASLTSKWLVTWPRRSTATSPTAMQTDLGLYSVQKTSTEEC